jgi:ketosteroid isomerase-like protein
MPKEALRKAVLDVFRARLSGNIPKTLSYLHPDVEYVFNGAGTGFPRLAERLKGIEAVAAALTDVMRAFRLENWRSTSLIVEADTAVLTWNADIVFIPTGESDFFEFVDVFRFRDGKIISMRLHTDSAKMVKLLSRRPGSH